MEISPQIHKVDGIRGANSYLVVGEDTIVVIDTGMPGGGGKIARYISELGRNPTEIEYIVLTHADIDHSGGARELGGITEAKIAIHEADAPRVSGGKDLKEMRGILGPISRLSTRIMRFHPVKPDITLRDGDEIGGLKVIHTPGHTEGSISLYKPGEALFAGDALRNKNGNPKPPAKLATLDMDKARESLRKISQFEFGILLAGHGKPVTHDASSKVRDLLKTGAS